MESKIASRQQQSEINGGGQQNIYPAIRRMMCSFALVFFAIWFMIASPAGPAMAAASQETQNDLQTYASANSDPILNQVEADIDANKFTDIESRLNEYLADHPDSARAYYDLGYVQFRTHQIGSSIKDLSKSLELNPKNAEAHKVLALSCSIIGRYDLAEVELLEAARLKPESAEIHYFLARTYYTRGVYPLAEKEFEKAIQLNPAYIKAYSNLGITMEALGNTEAALKNYTTGIQLEDRQEQKSAWPYIYLSAFYNRQKNPAEALTYARKALEINSASDTAFFEIAKAYRTQKQLPKAVDAARSAIAINSRVPDYYYVMGLVLRELGNQQASQEALAKYGELQQHSNDTLPDQKAQEPLVAPEPQ
jgi:tetratricopeptide (TPR) repeat protein